MRPLCRAHGSDAQPEWYCGESGLLQRRAAADHQLGPGADGTADRGPRLLQPGYPRDLAQIARDAADTYEIAYAPSAENWDNKFPRIRIACDRKGVKLQVQERYYALPDTRAAGARQTEILRASDQRPSDTAGIGLGVKVSPSAKGLAPAFCFAPSASRV